MSFSLETFEGVKFDPANVKNEYIVMYKGGFGNFFLVYSEVIERLKNYDILVVFSTTSER